MIIREATPDDILVIVSFQEKMAFETENLNLDRNVLKEGVRQVFANPAKGKYFVAEDNDATIAGSLLVTYEWSDWRNSTVLWIQSVYVEKEYRKKGVFSKMYDYIKEIVSNSDQYTGIRLYVDKTNTSAQDVYDRIGMNGEHYKLYEDMK